MLANLTIGIMSVLEADGRVLYDSCHICLIWTLPETGLTSACYRMESSRSFIVLPHSYMAFAAQ